MIPAAFTLILAALAVTAWAYIDARHDARQAHDAHTFEAEDHERTRQQLARTRADLAAVRQQCANHVRTIEVLLDAHARDIITDPLGSDVWPERALKVVRK